MRRFFLFGATLSGAVVTAVACSSTSESQPGSSSPDGAAPPGEDGGAPVPTTCSIQRAYVESCKTELTCGPTGFDAWCRETDIRINSEAYRRAEAECLKPENCDGEKRRDCEYRHYAKETLTAAQKSLVDAYCATCEPGDNGCAARATSYDPGQGIKSVTDIFIAAWELNDSLVDEIREKCTGPSLAADAGPGGTCAKAFATCSAEPYINRLPDCPK